MGLDFITRVDPGGIFIDVTRSAYGAVGDDSTVNTTALQAAIDAAQSIGSALYIPAGVYKTGALDIGTAPLIIRGDGWSTLVGDVFGHANWMTANAIKGTVLKFTNTTGSGLLIDGTNHRALDLRDIALLGPGSGSSVGINYDGTGSATLQNRIHNVFVVNFSKGVRFNDTFDNTFYDLHVWGCTKGLAYEGAGAITDQYFFRVDLQVNGTAIDGQAGNLQVFYGGLIQSNTVGISLAPAGAGGLVNWTFNAVWSEGNTTPLAMNSTNGGISAITFRDFREADTCMFTPTVVVAINRITFENCEWAGVSFTLAAGTNDWVFIRSNIAALNNSGGRTSKINTAIGGQTNSSLGSARFILTSATTITPDYNNGDVQEVTLAHNTTINVPTNPVESSTITYLIRQDGTGGRTVAFGSGYHYSWADTGNTANKYSSIAFRYIGSGQWIQLGAQAPYFS